MRCRTADVPVEHGGAELIRAGECETMTRGVKGDPVGSSANFVDDDPGSDGLPAW
jgi:hypothetical protein